MKQITIFMLLLLSVSAEAQPQQDQLASLHLDLNSAANDTMLMDVYFELALYYNEINIDSALFYLKQSIPIAQKLKLELSEAHQLENQGYMLNKVSNYPAALESFLQALKIAENPSSEKNVWNLSDGQTPRDERLKTLGFIYLTMGHLYGSTSNPNKQISSYLKSKSIAESTQNLDLNLLVNWNLGGTYYNLNKLDSALLYTQTALGLISKSDYIAGKYDGGVLRLLGNIYLEKGNFDLALDAFQKALKLIREQNNLIGLGRVHIALSNFYQMVSQPDSSLMHAYKGLQTFKTVGNFREIVNAYYLLSSAFSEMNKTDSAFTYLKLATSISDSLMNADRSNLLAYQNLSFNEQIRLRELEEEKIQIKTKIRTYAMLSGIAVFMLIAFLLFQNNKNKQKANMLLKEQKEEIQSTLHRLESTQSQLIQSEKMASLGELTAGIAHEIQNPLNFVNNFSEISSELLEEIKEELQKGNTEDVEAIVNDLIKNLNKIHHHGERASSIVKGMLDHSRSSDGKRELTNINQLTDEYLRLAYHGMRAKDKNFNISYETEFDDTVGKIMIVPQDIGRVILNIINNAFQACTERSRSAVSDKQINKSTNKQKVGLVKVSTKLKNNWVEIIISDNGPGIPDDIKDKIFQPFFTTKPAGQGTGLGLSLSYDIVKAHGGELQVDSEEGVGSSFVIYLPILEYKV